MGKTNNGGLNGRHTHRGAGYEARAETIRGNFGLGDEQVAERNLEETTRRVKPWQPLRKTSSKKQ